MMTTSACPAELSETQFQRISALVKSLCGIDLHEGKQELVRSRLARRLRQLGLPGFAEYLTHLRQDASGEELTAMLDVLSTNLTSFFREPEHFAYLVQHLLPRWAGDGGQPRRLRLWSAGCSSGEEPYSAAICLREALADLEQWDIGILATDLSTRVLRRARAGLYAADRLTDVPPDLLSRHFERRGSGDGRSYQVCAGVRRLVHFARLNLIGPWPMRGPFGAIFCRNVMIYFDKPTQERLINRYFDLLAPGGTLFVGHSESLTGIRHQYRYVQPTIYEKPA
jgi:chemotaxis protein methyltransferase CheR